MPASADAVTTGPPAAARPYVPPAAAGPLHGKAHAMHETLNRNLVFVKEHVGMFMAAVMSIHMVLKE